MYLHGVGLAVTVVSLFSATEVRKFIESSIGFLMSKSFISSVNIDELT